MAYELVLKSFITMWISDAKTLPPSPSPNVFYNPTANLASLQCSKPPFQQQAPHSPNTKSKTELIIPHFFFYNNVATSFLNLMVYLNEKIIFFTILSISQNIKTSAANYLSSKFMTFSKLTNIFIMCQYFMT